MNEGRVVCLNCIDGRVQLPVIHWVQQQCKVNYVDMITEPGIDGLLANRDKSLEAIFQKVRISIEHNNAKVIVVVGHNDCKGNPASDSIHKNHIRLAVECLKEEFSSFDVIGIWVDKEWKVERVERQA